MIVMDEESDEFLGETFPYTYASHFHTFEKLANDRPKVINYFVNLVEPQGELEQINLTRFKGMVSSYISGGGYLDLVLLVMHGEKSYHQKVCKVLGTL